MRKLLMLEEETKNDDRVYLYKAGNQCVDITGGWDVFDGFNYNSYVEPIFNKNYVQVYAEPIYQSCTLQTKNKIDFSLYNTINIELEVTMPMFTNAGNDWSYCVIGIYANKITRGASSAGGIKDIALPKVVTDKTILKIDITNVKTSSFFAAWATNSYSHSKVEYFVYNIWLEK